MSELEKILDTAPQDIIIQKTFMTMNAKLDTYNHPLCSVSGGGDSDIMIDLIERVKPHFVKYVFFDTGIEYQATKRHLDYLQERYGIVIERRPAVVPVPLGCKRYGQPFLSKQVSEFIERLQRHGFKWEDKPFDVLYAEYPKCKAALRWWCNKWGKGSSFNISKNKLLKEFMIANPPWFPISVECCMGAKKKTAYLCDTEFNADLKITGERRAEGGARATANTSCFTPSKDEKIASYRPLFFWDDADKTIYENHYCILHSNCYTVWGMKRTGCAGCPFGSHFENELKIIKTYEPQLFKAVNSIFGDSYRYRQQYNEYKAHRRSEEATS